MNEIMKIGEASSGTLCSHVGT